MFTNDELKEGLQEFAELYAKRPIKNNFGGGHSPHYYYLWWLLRKLDITHVVESGIWKGQSTWLLEQCDLTFIASIDIDLSLREYISTIPTQVVYMTNDFKGMKLDTGILNNTLVFFDDHVNHFERLAQCREKGIRHVIFDDNYPAGDNERLDKERAHLNGRTLKQFFDEGKVTEHDIKVRDIGKVRYFEFPPIGDFPITRWGDSLDNYPTKPALYQLGEMEGIPNCYFGERKEYTWICYVELLYDE